MFGKKDDLSPEQVTELIERVKDPILGKNLVELGMLKDLKIEKHRIHLGIELPTPAWEPKDLLEQELRKVLAEHQKERDLEIAWTSQVRSSRPSAAGGQNLVPGARNIILVASAKGGVGKSTIAANIAAALGRLGANVGLLDADIYGPSIPTMFGTRQMPEVAEGGSKLKPLVQHGVKLMSIGFVVDPKEAMSWRGPMLNGALIQFMRDVEWGDLDYMILDLPPGTGDVQLTIAQNVKVSGAILVSTPQDVALADVTRGKAMFDRVGIPTLGVIENMSAFTCTNCQTVHHIFASGGARKLAEDLKIPVLGEVPIEIGVRQAADAGKPEVLVNEQSSVSKAIFSITKRIATQLAEDAVKAESSASKGGARTLRIIQ